MDATRLADRRERFGPTLATMGTHDSMTLIRNTNGNDLELTALAADNLEVRLRANPDEVVQAELDALRADPNTPEGQARRELSRAEMLGEFVGHLERFAGAVPGSLRQGSSRDDGDAGLSRQFLEHFFTSRGARRLFEE